MLLIITAIHFNWSEQMGEGKRAHLPFSVFFNIYLGHHKRICHFTATHYCNQVDII